MHVDSWKTTYRGILPDDFLEGLGYRGREAIWANLDPERVLVAESADDAIVGFSAFGRERSEDRVYQGEVYSIYLLEEWQGRGIGVQLMRLSARALHAQGHRGLLVWVLAANRNARRFYEKLGGKVLRSQPLTIEGSDHEEVAYGWRDTAELRA